jgi:hypothetical protein
MFLGYYDPNFLKDKEYLFNINTLWNIEKHLLEIYFLDIGGDI